MGSIMKIKSEWNQEKINTTDNDLRELGGKKKEHVWNQKKWRNKKNERKQQLLKQQRSNIQVIEGFKEHHQKKTNSRNCSSGNPPWKIETTAWKNTICTEEHNMHLRMFDFSKAALYARRKWSNILRYPSKCE